MRDAAGELADRFHSRALIDLVLQRALAGDLEHIDDRGLGIAVLLLDRRHVKAAVALAAAAQAGVDRRDLALSGSGLADRTFQGLAVALGHSGEDRAAVAQRAREHAGEQRIGARDFSGFVDGGDRHRRRLEEAHEADFRGALRIVGLAARAVEHQRP